MNGDNWLERMISKSTWGKYYEELRRMIKKNDWAVRQWIVIGKNDWVEWLETMTEELKITGKIEEWLGIMTRNNDWEEWLKRMIEQEDREE